jgi:hypothetical protein
MSYDKDKSICPGCRFLSEDIHGMSICIYNPPILVPSHIGGNGLIQYESRYPTINPLKSCGRKEYQIEE